MRRTQISGPRQHISLENVLRRRAKEEKKKKKKIGGGGGGGASDWIWWLKMAHGNNVVNDIQVYQTQAVQSAQTEQYRKLNT